MKTSNFLIMLFIIVSLLGGFYFFLSPYTFAERTVTAYSLIGLFALSFYFGVKLLAYLGRGKK